MRIEVVPGEVRVVAPLGTKERQINLFVNSKQRWIRKKLADFEQTQSCFSIDEGKMLLFGELLSKRDVISLAENDKMDFNVWLDSRLLAQLMSLLAKYPDLIPERIRLGNAKTRWGSCSAKGVVMINRKLVHAPIAVVEYVLIHELVHLKHRNHSRLFWSEVAGILEDYKEPRKWLKEQGAYL